MTIIAEAIFGESKIQEMREYFMYIQKEDDIAKRTLEYLLRWNRCMRSGDYIKTSHGKSPLNSMIYGFSGSVSDDDMSNEEIFEVVRVLKELKQNAYMQREFIAIDLYLNLPGGNRKVVASALKISRDKATKYINQAALWIYGNLDHKKISF